MAHAIDTLTQALKIGDVMGDDVQAALNHLAACEDALKTMGTLLAGAPEWNDAVFDELVDTIRNVMPDSGSVVAGRDESGIGPAERYLHDLSEHGFVVYMGDIVYAQSVDDNYTPREDDEDE